MSENKKEFKLYTRPHSHMAPVLTVQAEDIDKAIKSFKRWYKRYGVNVDTMKTFVAVPIVDGNADFDNANGWDELPNKTTYYPRSKN